MRKLYKGKITLNIVVLAEDEDEARDVMSDNAIEEMGNGSFSVSGITQIKSKADIPAPWTGTELPWGKQELTEAGYEKFILEILNEDVQYTNARLK